MVSWKLKLLFLISIPFFIAHGMEEYWLGFYNTDPFTRFVFQPFAGMTTPQATFLLFQIAAWVLLIISFFLLLGGRWPLCLLAILALVFVLELHHLWEALRQGGYYPGLATAIPLYLIGFLFWKEWLKGFQLSTVH